MGTSTSSQTDSLRSRIDSQPNIQYRHAYDRHIDARSLIDMNTRDRLHTPLPSLFVSDQNNLNPARNTPFRRRPYTVYEQHPVASTLWVPAEREARREYIPTPDISQLNTRSSLINLILDLRQQLDIYEPQIDAINSPIETLRSEYARLINIRQNRSPFHGISLEQLRESPARFLVLFSNNDVQFLNVDSQVSDRVSNNTSHSNTPNLMSTFLSLIMSVDEWEQNLLDLTSDEYMTQKKDITLHLTSQSYRDVKDTNSAICSICQETLKPDDIVDKLTCCTDGIYHDTCIREWGNYQPKCPNCRAEIPHTIN